MNRKQRQENSGGKQEKGRNRIMKYWIGIDGGGTKTALAAADANGTVLAARTAGGCSYQSLGVQAVVRLLQQEIGALAQQTGLALTDCAGCCLGLPCCGENPEIDRLIRSGLEAALSPLRLHLVNDVEVGWAGSLSGAAGVHIVSGTGSIAFGKSADGRSARCGGWNEFYGDEGSCYWIGRQAMGLFSKEADGRLPQGALYRIVRAELGLVRDFSFTEVIQERWAPRRDKVASFQRYAYQAAGEGDEAAAGLYRAAARELALLVRGVREKLGLLREETRVSYSGGLFQTGELILTPLRLEVEAQGGVLRPPERTATEGALLLARERFPA